MILSSIIKNVHPCTAPACFLIWFFEYFNSHIFISNSATSAISLFAPQTTHILAKCMRTAEQRREGFKKTNSNWNFSIEVSGWVQWGVIFQFKKEKEKKVALKWSTCSETWNKQIKYFCQLWPPPACSTRTLNYWLICNSGNPEC